MPTKSKKLKWKVFRNRHIPAVLPLYSYWSWSLKEKIGVESGMTVNVWDKGDYEAVWEENGFKNCAKYAFDFLCKNKYRLDKIRQQGIDAGDEVIKLCKGFAMGVEKASFEDFLGFFKELDNLYSMFTEKSMLLWLFTGGLVEKKLNEKLKRFSEKNRNEIFSIMSQPQIESYSQIEEREFEELVKLAKEIGIENISDEIKKFSDKYFWFPFEYIGPDIWDEKSVKSRVMSELDGSIRNDDEKNFKEQQDKCIKKHKLSQEIVDLFSILQIVTIMQDDRKMIHAHSCYYLNGIIIPNLAKRLNVSVEQARYLEINLFKNFLKDRDLKKFQKELQKREDFLVITQVGPKAKAFTGDDADVYLKKLGINRGISENDSDIISGQPANPGKAKGPVRILKTSSNVIDYKEGSILVTGMTTPDFVPLMKKSSAIITDEGGVTCHAAITSRELNKPCIVGTNNSTKILKDGDHVEVDANKGVVRILDKNGE